MIATEVRLMRLAVVKTCSRDEKHGNNFRQTFHQENKSLICGIGSKPTKHSTSTESNVFVQALSRNQTVAPAARPHQEVRGYGSAGTGRSGPVCFPVFESGPGTTSVPSWHSVWAERPARRPRSTPRRVGSSRPNVSVFEERGRVLEQTTSNV